MEIIVVPALVEFGDCAFQIRPGPAFPLAKTSFVEGGNYARGTSCGQLRRLQRARSRLTSRCRQAEYH